MAIRAIFPRSVVILTGMRGVGKKRFAQIQISAGSVSGVELLQAWPVQHPSPSAWPWQPPEFPRPALPSAGFVRSGLSSRPSRHIRFTEAKEIPVVGSDDGQELLFLD